MPVTRLICEGTSDSLDAPVLRAILAGLRVDIAPAGAKSGMRERVLAHRQAARDQGTFALVDGDWHRAPLAFSAANAVNPLRVGNPQVHIGWSWERKEIENYLLDPVVVQRAFALSDTQAAEYEAALDQALDSMGDWQAARMALAMNLPRPGRVNLQIGPAARGDRALIERELQRMAAEWIAERRIDPGALLSDFKQLSFAAQRSGSVRQFALHLYAGKDVGDALNTSARLRGLGKPLPNDWKQLCEAVVERASTAADVHTWLPEWGSLRAAVQAVP